ncbi:MAG: hypothetical protein FRX49_10413 [Trebouxia sp. A1-2]|nr:MAG: hypothetical protein FRX49_10413 [Trebouxia sp. A1-2]
MLLRVQTRLSKRLGGGETGHAADNIHKKDTKSEGRAPQTSPGNQQPGPAGIKVWLASTIQHAEKGVNVLNHGGLIQGNADTGTIKLTQDEHIIKIRVLSKNGIVESTFGPATVHTHTHVRTQGVSGHTETRNFSFFCLERAVHIVMASAAAVASSSKEELDMGMPVRSHTMV